jgi:histidinol-phosphate phosphatase family protein
MRKRAVFLDRDGTISRDVHYCCRVEDFEILPTVPQAIRLLNEYGFEVVVVTNQSGVARGYFTEETLLQIHQHMRQELAEYGAQVNAIYYCPHHPDDRCDCAKPGPGLLLRAAEELGIDLRSSFMIGDAVRDVEAGKTAGCRTVLIADGLGTGRELTDLPDYIAADLLKAAEWIVDNGFSL